MSRNIGLLLGAVIVVSLSCRELTDLDNKDFSRCAAGRDCGGSAGAAIQDASAGQVTGGRMALGGWGGLVDSAGLGGHLGSGAPNGVAGTGGDPSSGSPAAAGGVGPDPSPEGHGGQMGGAGNLGAAGQGEPTGGGAECGSHSECNVGGISNDPSLCLDGRCVRLRNDDPNDTPSDPGWGDCRQVLGADKLTGGIEPFLFGALSSAQTAMSRGDATRNYDLAIREFAAKGGVTIGGKTRIPVAVVCNSVGVTRERLARTFDHLVGALGVPAIIPTLQVSDLKWAFEYVHASSSHDVLFISPFGADGSVLALEDRGLLWHLLGGPAEIARAYIPLVERVEAHIRRTYDISAPVRLALLDSQASFQSDLGTLLDEQLRFNGKSARENGRDFLRLRVPPDLEEGWLEIAIDEMRAFAPDIIVYTGGQEATAMLSFIELMSAPERSPFHVVSPHMLGESRFELRDYITGFDLFERIAGVNHAAAEDASLYQAYQSALSATFPEDTHLSGTENFYDAGYYVIYSAVAAGSHWPLNGTRMAAGLARLLEGPAYRVGGLHIPETVTALRSLPSIRLQGTMGLADFDRDTGGWRGSGSVFCVRPGQEHPEFVWDVLRFNQESGELNGEFPCIPGF